MKEVSPTRNAGLVLLLYRLLSPLAARVALLRDRKRMIAEGIPVGRSVERKGRATQPRPSGQLVWFHAASIGESLSILPLVNALADEMRILVTSGTATSAKLLAKRLPDGAVHQFVPFDTPGAAKRFMNHWRPDVGVFVESEIWPTLIDCARRKTIPLFLINARMSDRTLARWAKMPKTASTVFSKFQRIVTQNQRTLDGLRPFVPNPDTRLSLGGNMKAAADPLPVDETALAQWQSELGARPTWIASSTHEGEDDAVLDAHAVVRKTHPDTLLILVPRHPHRGYKIAEAARLRGFETARLGGEEPVTPQISLLVADSLGDLGLWYRLSPIVFLAGSFGAAGGHNPWEPIALGAALLHGPNVVNAENDYKDLHAAGAAIEVADAAQLGKAVSRLLSSSEDCEALRGAARKASSGADGLVDHVASEIRHFLEVQARGR